MIWQCICLLTIIKQECVLSDVRELNLIRQILYQTLIVLPQLLTAAEVLSLDLFDCLVYDFY